ncbi:hypothetical protein ES705_25041 [subsurface metagenome]
MGKQVKNYRLVDTTIDLLIEDVNDLKEENHRLVDRINAIQDLISFVISDHVDNYHK